MWDKIVDLFQIVNSVDDNLNSANYSLSLFLNRLPGVRVNPYDNFWNIGSYETYHFGNSLGPWP